MKYIILKGLKLALPLLPKISRSTAQQVIEFRFTASCRYEVKSNEGKPPEEHRINKLYGVGFIDFSAWLKWKPMHHIDSVRIGWRYNKPLDKVEVLIYTYVNGKRDWKHLTYCTIGLDYSGFILHYPYYRIIIRRSSPASESPVQQQAEVSYTHHKKWWYKLQPRFESIEAAPHTITLFIKKLH